MSMRNTSGKFSLANLGFKSDSSPHSRQTSGTYDDNGSPNGTSAFDKLGKKLAHTTLLPALGNKDLRGLQDVITAEKGVLQAADKMAAEASKASVALPAYGSQEGPDLADVLTHSSTLLNHLSDAFTVFANHQASMRASYKKIREREEALEEVRRRRRRTAQNAESAEKKLAKMGSENKGLPSQTDLLERLRSEIRQLDTDILTEEAKLGDYKRLVVKEALSLKFGGLEELGEKLCIIGELGKLLLEEIPLEETPPGYGRAPYSGYEKTENAANEATKCLATVRFDVPSIVSRPPGLPHPTQHAALSTPHLPGSQAHIASAEEYAYPAETSRDYSMNDDVYGGISNPYDSNANQYDEFGGVRGKASEVVFDPAERLRPEEEGQNYEWEQQRQMDEEKAREQATLKAPWDPLNIKKDRASPEPVSLTDAPTLAPVVASIPPVAVPPGEEPHAELEPVPLHEPARTMTPAERYQTPEETLPPTFAENEPSSPPVSNGKITAAAFRKAVKKPSVDDESIPAGSRRLPVPPLHPVSATAEVLERDYPDEKLDSSPPPHYGEEGSLR